MRIFVKRAAGVVGLLLLCCPLAEADTPEQKLLFKRAYDVIEARCFQCHKGDQKRPKGRLKLDSLEGMLRGGKSGEALVVGHADQSEMLRRMKLPAKDKRAMPKRKEKATAVEIQAIAQWIDAGAPWFDSIVNGEPVVTPKEVAEMHEDMGVAVTPKPVAGGEPTEEQHEYFKTYIEPLFRNHCSGCHGNQSEKGGLRLDLKKAAFVGGDSGVVIVPGKPKESDVLARMLLPLDDDEVMPPKKKERVPPAAIGHLEKWIEMGAPWPEPKSKMERGGENHATRFTASLTDQQSEDLAWLKRNHVYVEPLIWEGGGVRVVMAHSESIGGDKFKRLESMADQVQWLDVSRRELPTESQIAIKSLQNLRILHLENTNINDAALKRMGVFPELDYLNLHSTGIGDGSVDHIAKMKKLRVIYVWNTKMTKQGIDRLQGLLPHTKVVSGL